MQLFPWNPIPQSRMTRHMIARPQNQWWTYPWISFPSIHMTKTEIKIIQQLHKHDVVPENPILPSRMALDTRSRIHTVKTWHISREYPFTWFLSFPHMKNTNIVKQIHKNCNIYSFLHVIYMLPNPDPHHNKKHDTINIQRNRETRQVTWSLNSFLPQRTSNIHDHILTILFSSKAGMMRGTHAFNTNMHAFC